MEVEAQPTSPALSVTETDYSHASSPAFARVIEYKEQEGQIFLPRVLSTTTQSGHDRSQRHLDNSESESSDAGEQRDVFGTPITSANGALVDQQSHEPSSMDLLQWNGFSQAYSFPELRDQLSPVIENDSDTQACINHIGAEVYYEPEDSAQYPNHTSPGPYQDKEGVYLRLYTPNFPHI